ncbi:MAG: tetratricopeptide repeat protein [Candidatus Omnitrophica bacterium]|nr:tetratricopeptide repeat protein [Candidatus Omnitrophota bacterium]
MPFEAIRKYKRVIPVILIILSGFFIYANSLTGDFIWDDEAFIINNSYIKDWSKTGLVFTRDSGEGACTELNFYRPIQLLSCMADYSLWGLNPFGYHLTCVMLHILVALAFYGLIRLLFADTTLAFFSAMLFLAHPVNTEAVSYISGRSDLLSALFLLLCLIFYVRAARQPKLSYLLFIFFSCLLAFLSKENALIIVSVILLYHCIFRVRIRRGVFFWPAAVSLLYMLARAVNLRSFFLGGDTVLRRIPGFFAAIAGYLRILFLPLNLHMDYGNRVFPFSHPQVLCGAAVFLLLVFFALKVREKDRLLSFGLLWFIIALLPANSIYPVNSFYMAEHWLYLPALGFFLILARQIVSLYRKRGLRACAAAVFAFLLCAYSYLTVRQNGYWESEEKLYGRVMEFNPGSYMAHNNLGNMYMREGDTEGAEREFLLAVKYNPDFLPAYCKALGIIYEKGEPDARDRASLESMEANPACARAYYKLGNSYYDRNDKEKSISLMRRAVELDPGYFEAYNNLASSYAETGDTEEAVRLWEEAVRIKPEFAAAHFNLSVYYFQLKQYDLAIEHCDEVLRLGFEVDRRFLDELEPFRKDAPPC